MKHETFGWSADADSFLLSDTLYRNDGNHSGADVSRVLAPYMAGTGRSGSLDAWKGVASVYARPGMEPYAFALLAAFGAPLMKFTTHGGAMLSLRGKAGIGKTTCQRLICSVYGNPYSPQALFMPRDAAPKARVQRLNIMHSLPVCLDELTNIKPPALSDLCYTLSQGIGGVSVGRDGITETEARSWNTLLVASSNVSLYEILARQRGDATAEFMRLFEYQATPLALDKPAIDAMFEPLAENYGWAGHAYIDYITRNNAAVKSLLRNTTRNFDIDNGVMPRERFWSALISCCLVGGDIAQGLGLIDYDMCALYDWVCKRLVATRNDVRQAVVTPEEAVLWFLEANEAQTAIMTSDRCGTSAWRETRNIFMKQIPADNVHPTVLKCEADGILRVQRRAFLAWCDECKLSPAQVRATLYEKGILLAPCVFENMAPWVWKNKSEECMVFDENVLRGEPTKLVKVPVFKTRGSPRGV